jgi:hypothetical protein
VCVFLGSSTVWVSGCPWEFQNIVTWLAIDGFWVDRIYWDSLIYSVTTIHHYTHTSVHSHVFTDVAWQRLPTVNVALPLDSRTVPGLSYSSQWLNLSSPLTHSQTNSSLVLLITYRHGPHRKHQSCVAVQLLRSCLSAEPLPSNDYCTVAYLVVVA